MAKRAAAHRAQARLLRLASSSLPSGDYCVSTILIAHRPKLRDRLITTQPFIPFDSFFIPFTTTVSLNWPYKPQDCLLPASRINSALSSTSSMAASSPFSTAVHAGSPQGPPTPQPAGSTPGTTIAVAKEDDQWLINPAFETHLRDLSNWSLGQAFRTTFPHFADAVHIKEGR